MPASKKTVKHTKVRPVQSKSGLKSSYSFGGKISAMLVGFVLFGVLFGGYLLISSRAALNDTNTALPPNDVSLCKNPANPAVGQGYDWIVALNNDTKWCSLIWANQQAHPQFIDAMGGSQTVYKLTKFKFLVDRDNNPYSIDQVNADQAGDAGIVVSYTLRNKAISSDFVTGDDSTIPLFPNGGGMPGYDVTCRNENGVNADFKQGENTIRYIVTMYNTGDTDWTADGGYALSYTPVSEGVYSSSKVVKAIPAGTTIKRGQKYDFDVTLPMPTANGYYLLNSVMTKNGTPFGAIAICQLQRFNAEPFATAGTVAPATSPTPSPISLTAIPDSVAAGTNISKLVQDQIKTLPSGTTAVIRNANWQTPATNKTVTQTGSVSGTAYQSGQYLITIKNSSGQILGSKRINVRRAVPVNPLGN